jgi:hypothetical protein
MGERNSWATCGNGQNQLQTTSGCAQRRTSARRSLVLTLCLLVEGPFSGGPFAAPAYHALTTSKTPAAISAITRVITFWCWRFRADAAPRIWSSRRVRQASAFARWAEQQIGELRQSRQEQLHDTSRLTLPSEGARRRSRTGLLDQVAVEEEQTRGANVRRCRKASRRPFNASTDLGGEKPSRLGQCQLALYRLQVFGHDRPGERLPPLWRV